MMKIVASLLIFGLCANVAFGIAPVSTSQSGSLSGLNSTAIKVWSGANQTSDSAWDSSCATCGTNSAAVSAGISQLIFGPGATNDTSYVWGLPSSNTGSSITKIVKRTLNNTIVGWGNDTVEASVIAADASITAAIPNGEGLNWAVGPGYLAIVSCGTDGAATPNNQAYITLVTGSSGSITTNKLTSTSDVLAAAATASPANPCTATTFGAGNVWYDQGAGAFFYTYWKQVVTQGTPTNAASCASTGNPSTVNTIYLGGIYVNGSAYWTTPLAIAAANLANDLSSAGLIGGVDNSLNATNIYLVYKDAAATGSGTTGVTYVSKTTKATTTTTGGSFGTLVQDYSTGTVNTNGYILNEYTPVSVWSSNFTYGITVANSSTTYATSSVTTYSFVNYLNGTTTATAPGITSSGATAVGQFWGWQLNTGYTLLGQFGTSTSGVAAYVWGTFYGNGTANMTATTLGSIQGTISVYEDVNGTNWIGWTDVDTANSDYAYNGYLAKLQGQLNVPSGASILSAISAFFALFLAAIFVF